MHRNKSTRRYPVVARVIRYIGRDKWHIWQEGELRDRMALRLLVWAGSLGSCVHLNYRCPTRIYVLVLGCSILSARRILKNSLLDTLDRTVKTRLVGLACSTRVLGF